MPSRSTLTVSSVYFLSAALFTFSHSVIAESDNIDNQIREAAVAQLNQNKVQALEKALAEAEKESIGDTPAARQEHLQKILRLTIAKANHEYSFKMEQASQELLTKLTNELKQHTLNDNNPQKSARLDQSLEENTALALHDAQVANENKNKPQTSSTSDSSNNDAQTSATTPQIQPSAQPNVSSDQVATSSQPATTEEKATPQQTTKTATSEAEKTTKNRAEAPEEATQEKTVSVKTVSPEPASESDQKSSQAVSTQAQTTPEKLPEKSPEKTIAQAPAAQPPTNQAPSKPAIELKTEQWMYIGQFKDGSWTEKTIAIGDTLPQTGQQYAVSQSVHIRAGLPTNKENMPAVIANLGNNAKITLVELKASGKQGYYWGKIER